MNFNLLVISLRIHPLRIPQIRFQFNLINGPICILDIPTKQDWPML